MSTLLTLLALLGAPDITAEVSRLEGHDVVVAKDRSSYVIRSVAGEGKPLVGVVELRANQLWLNTGAKRYRMIGPLAVPRIAGPRYKVWVLGEVSGQLLRARRLGVLAKPRWRRH